MHSACQRLQCCASNLTREQLLMNIVLRSFFLHLSLVDLGCTGFPACVTAAASLSLSLDVFCRVESWPRLLQQYSGVTLQVTCCRPAVRLCRTCLACVLCLPLHFPPLDRARLQLPSASRSECASGAERCCACRT